jgi:predicted nucleic acid-binding protein
MPSVYLETSVIGYLASRRSNDVIVAGSQQATHDWWNNYRHHFELFISQPVLDECAAGDSTAAAERQVYLDGIPVLAVTLSAIQVSRDLLREVALPKKAEIDALHIAIAAEQRIDYLLTWNCKHIANASLRLKIEGVLKSAGLIPPILCTPQELSDV